MDVEWYEDPDVVGRNHLLFETYLGKRNGNEIIKTAT
jgi:hypothetical protein